MTHASAREIALALGVPPMLLGIPGDNTFSNYQEANRTFWRNTVIPLVCKASQSLSSWLAPAFGNTAMFLEPDLDEVEALAPEREALWSRLDKATFLTANEKREAAGYGPIDGGDILKFTDPLLDHKWPGQPRTDVGRFDFGTVGDVHLVGGYPISILEEDALGGHTYAEHVKKSENYLKERITGSRVNVPYIFGAGLKRAGSFPSLEVADKLTNSVISDPENAAKIEKFVRGDLLFMLPELNLFRTFGSPTGIEAYSPNENVAPIMRTTNGVQVRLIRTSKSPKGYYVNSAFPINED